MSFYLKIDKSWIPILKWATAALILSTAISWFSVSDREYATYIGIVDACVSVVACLWATNRIYGYAFWTIVGVSCVAEAIIYGAFNVPGDAIINALIGLGLLFGAYNEYKEKQGGNTK